MTEDRGETPSDLEPLIPEESSRHRRQLDDLAYELATKSAALTASLPEAVRLPLASLVRSMNCYYSNLIEGHHTHPIDIERAINADFSADPERRNLQLEALAHVNVQKWIDEGGLKTHPLHPDSLAEIHRRFCADLPAELLIQKDADGNDHPVVPGVFRDGYVQVGNHIPPSPGSVPRLLGHLNKMYAFQSRLGKVVYTASSHHRLVWIHPFSDLNGRVSRMVAHAMLLEQVGSAGLWSVARGLGRAEANYKAFLKAADEPRHGGADGRGQLSESRLAEFSAFFLKTCVDQVDFMTKLMQPAELRYRITDWAQRAERSGELPKGADRVMKIILMEGAVERRDIADHLGVKERQARNVTSKLLELEAVTSEHARAPLRLNFPAKLAGDWMPGLFPNE